MGDVMELAADHVEAIRGQAHKVLDEMLGRRRRRWERALIFALGFKAGALFTALAGAWWWYRGGREL